MEQLEIAVKQETQTPQRATSDSMLSIIERAVMSPDFDVVKLKELLELRERWEKNEARKAFVSAMIAFKANPPKITKNKHVHYASSIPRPAPGRCPAGPGSRGIPHGRPASRRAPCPAR